MRKPTNSPQRTTAKTAPKTVKQPPGETRSATRNFHSGQFPRTGQRINGGGCVRGQPQRREGAREREMPPDDESQLAPEHEPRVAPLDVEPEPPPPGNLFSAGLVRPAAYAPLDDFLAAPKPLRPPTPRRTP